MKRTISSKSQKFKLGAILGILVYTIVYAILCYILYPTIVGQGSVEYKITEKYIEVNLGEWEYIVVNGYIENGERTEFKFETNSVLISKNQILKEEDADSESEIIVDSVQKYEFNSFIRKRIIWIILPGVWALILLAVCYVYENSINKRY